MRPLLLVSTVLLATAIALVVSCGGSSSETPWPVEPDPSLLPPQPDAVPVPAGEEDAGARRRRQ